MRKATDKSLISDLRAIKGTEKPQGIVVFSIMKNERFFIHAFLDHYRNIGADHFLILDDGSDDGTLEYLLDQGDVTVLTSSFAYGEVYKRQSLRFWRKTEMRAGIRLKALIPSQYLANQWCIYADADEFLIMPPAYDNLRHLLRRLDSNDIRVVLGVVVEFYPEKVSDLKQPLGRIKSFGELVEACPYFDAVPLLRMTPLGDIERLNRSASGRLFDSFGVDFGSESEVKSEHEVLAAKGRKKLAIGSATHKLPIIKPGKRVYLLSGHQASVKPSALIAVTVCHFKFTPDALRRTDLAIQTGAWSQGSQKYTKYQLLFKKMLESNGRFLGSDSVSFSSVYDFEKSGNVWDFLR